MIDPFENKNTKINKPVPIQDNFPDFNAQWFPPLEEGVKTRLGASLEKGSDILKKAMNIYWLGLGLVALLIILPPVIRFLYELSKWSFDHAGNLFQ